MWPSTPHCMPRTPGKRALGGLMVNRTVLCWLWVCNLQCGAGPAETGHLKGGETGHAKRLPLSAQHRHALWHAWLWWPVPHIWSGTGRPCGDDERHHHKLSILFKWHLEVSLTTIRTPDCGVELLPCCALVGFDANSLYPWVGAGHGHRGLPCQEWAGLWPGYWGHVPRLWSVAQQGFPPMAGLWGRSPQAGGPIACRQWAQGVTGPAPPTHGWLSSGHYHSVPVPLLLVSLSRLSWVWGHLAPHYCRGEARVQWKGWRLLEDHLWLHTHDHLGVRAGVPQADPSAAAVVSGWVGTVGGSILESPIPSSHLVASGANTPVLLQVIHEDHIFGLAQVDIHTPEGLKDRFRDYRPFSSVSQCPRRTQSKQGTVQRESAASPLPAAIVVTATVAAAVAAAAVAVAAVAAAAAVSQRQHCGHHHCGEEAQSSSRPGLSLWCDPLQPS